MERPEDPLLYSARLGVDAETFLHTPVGRYIQQRANDEIDAATHELIDAEPDDVGANTRLRMRILRARDAMEWLLEAISDGRRALAEIERVED